MRAIVFSTFRQVRDFVAAHENTLLPKLYTMDEFLRRMVVVPRKIFVDDASRVLYLYRAIDGLDIGKLGFERNFLSFVKNSEFVFRFFEELHAEGVAIETLRGADTYADFEDHLALLAQIRDRYAALLEAEGLTDRILVDDYRLNENFLRGFERIDLHVDGYLSRFELGVLKRIETPLHLHFATTPFNRKLLERLGLEEVPAHRRIEWRMNDGEILQNEPLAPVGVERVETAAFEERIDQVAFVLKKVEAFVEEGADPAKVAVVVPDEGFAEYLRLFDAQKNFNFAMGTPFTQSRYYRTLADLYDAVTDRSESAKEKMAGHEVAAAFEKVTDFQSFLDFLEGLETEARELKAIDEVKYGFASYAPLLAHATPLQLLHTWLQRLENLQLDDVGGGKVTVMGVLESRGKAFDGVVVVDFNEERVPKVSEKDLFLDSRLRKKAGMPTRADKENLQKNYYYRLLQNSARAAVCWVKNEEALPSRFLMELGLADKPAEDARYRPIIAPAAPPPALFDGTIEGENPFRASRRLTPTRLKDWLECPRRYHYKYLLKIGKEAAEQKTVGTLIHEALEAAARAKESFDGADAYFAFVVDHLYRHAPDTLAKFDLALTWEPKLERFCRRDYERLVGSEQAVLEEWRGVTYRGFELSAKIDRVDVTPTTVRLIDYKTSKNLDKTLEDENDFQLLFYRLWARQAYPAKKVEALYFDLFKEEEKSRPLEEEQARLDEVLGALDGPERVAFSRTDEKDRCEYCDYKTACGRG
ncbi:RecB family exonuclease [Hydrogenimonas sp.]